MTKGNIKIRESKSQMHKVYDIYKSRQEFCQLVCFYGTISNIQSLFMGIGIDVVLWK